MTSSRTSPVDPWFEKLLQQCLASLYLLNLEGCPAADQVGKTAQLWVRLLWDKPHAGWLEEKDAKRIRAAFAAIAHTAKRWPSPQVFWERLPERPPSDRKQSVGPDWGRERQREADQAMIPWLRDLGYTRSGDPIGGEA